MYVTVSGKLKALTKSPVNKGKEMDDMLRKAIIHTTAIFVIHYEYSRSLNSKSTHYVNSSRRKWEQSSGAV